MFEQTSRYFHLENLTHVDENGHEIKYKSRRILPQPATVPSMVTIEVERGKRLDQICASTLGNPELSWKLGDANQTLALTDLEKRGTVLRIPLDGVGT
ncbi:MAG: hypothetical protein HRT35_34650 [Algicola sp.]|nr:hypothetical protein [Algicola sp.]